MQWMVQYLWLGLWRRVDRLAGLGGDDGRRGIDRGNARQQLGLQSLGPNNKLKLHGWV